MLSATGSTLHRPIPGQEEISRQVVQSVIEGGHYTPRASRYDALVDEPVTVPLVWRRAWLGDFLFKVGLAMLLGLVLCILGTLAFGAVVTRVVDPLTYTQHDLSVETPYGKVIAFLDEDHHVDLLIVPSGDATKSRILVGPLLAGSDEHTMLLVQVHGTTAQVTGNSVFLCTFNLGENK